MSRSRLHTYELTPKRVSYLAPALAIVIIILAAGPCNGQSNPPTSSFRSGQSIYIVAFRIIPFPIIPVEAPVNRQREYINYDLDAERKVRKRIEEWQFFKVAEKPSEADFIFLVNLDETSMRAWPFPLMLSVGILRRGSIWMPCETTHLDDM